MADTGEAEAEEEGGGGSRSAWAGFPSYSSLRGRGARRPEDGHSSTAAADGGRGYSWRRVFSLATIFKTFFASHFSAFLATHWLR